MPINELFRFDSLSILIAVFIAIFSILTVIYSFSFMHGKKRLVSYYFYIALTFLASLGTVFSNNLVLFIVFWGFLTLLLYLLIGFGEKKTTSYTAKKALIIVGGTDALMLIGMALLWKTAGTFQMGKINLALTSPETILAYLCFAAGAFAKAGSMPFHAWVPDAAEDAPTSVAAFLPASLDKLLGIYFLARLSLDMFHMNTGMNLFLMAMGSVTIIAAVMKALTQHDMKRLLGYHAVSDAGYMILGIGTGNLLGIAGGLFHMLNSAIYKSCLFFSSGTVEKKSGTTDLEKLGGLARIMPITFVTFLIASLSISGIPPFNGFASKWMIYQGIISSSSGGDKLWVVWLVAAMFGSALTLDSFLKLIHAVFLRQKAEGAKDRRSEMRDVSPSMLTPSIALAGLCIVFGVFMYQVPLKMLIFPVLGGDVSILKGTWDSYLATALLVLSVLMGFVIYFIGNVLNSRDTDIFIGGEKGLKK